MTKNINFVVGLLITIIALIPLMCVHAETYTVNNEADLKSAISNNDIDIIILGSDISTTSKINITRELTIDGAGHTIRYTGTFGESDSPDNTVWGGIYVLQVYKTTATIKNIKLTGGNAGLLINGSKVNFVGTIDVSGNGFGGIELGQGQGVDEVNRLTLDDAEIINADEDANHPTVWVPSDSDPAEMVIDGMIRNIATGDELTLTEVNELFGIVPPKTLDNISYYILTLLGSIASIGYVKVKKFN